MPRLYSYCLPCDDGAAPNPFWGICTLVICKPAIRRTAQVGDWVVGTGAKYSRKAGGGAVDLTDHIIYAMRVSAKMKLQEYEAYAARELPNKKPDWSHSDHRRRLGDAIYSFKGPEVKQLPSVHNKANMKTDLSGKNALLSNHFFYWGDQAILLPPTLRAIAQNRQGHRVNLNAGYLDAFIDWIEGLGAPPGEPLGEPLLDLFADDTSANWCASCRGEADDQDTEQLVEPVC